MNTEKKYILQFAVAVVAVCFAYFFCITFIPVPQSGLKYADIILGALIGSGFTLVMQFYLGSSKGSQDKTKV